MSPSTRLRDRTIAVLVLLALVLGWQVLSIMFPQEAAPGVPLVPGWETLFTGTLLSMAMYWPGGWGFGSVAAGDPPSYTFALLAIAYHSGMTLIRLGLGLLLGTLVGGGLALLVSASDIVRMTALGPVQFLRALPLLAMVPLFQLWFGVSFVGEVTFVAYGVAVIIFAAVLNAVGNVPDVYVQNARVFGAGRTRMYATVVVPAILPEFQSALLLSLGSAWAAVMGAEFLAARSGLGFIITYSRRFGYLDRMFLVALIIVVLAAVSFALCNLVFARLTRWTLKGRR